MSQLAPGAGAASGPAPETGTPGSRRASAWRLLLSSPTGAAGLVVLAVLILAAVTARWLAPYGPNDIDVPNALAPPSGRNWLGTDELGRDVFSRVLLAAEVSLQVALVSVAIALVVGVTFGVIAGYAGGWLDLVVMRSADVLFAFPILLLALAIVAIQGPAISSVMIAIGVVYTPIFARVARASTLSLRQEPYVQAARTMGVPTWQILLRHILPGISGPVTVQTSISLAFAILSEAALSFLGLGVQPPNPSWGRMLFDAQGFLASAWWMAVFPGLAILVTVLAFNLVGDAVRDVLDPRQRSMIESRRKR
ncbi:ABC transporter permease [Sediminivirga luteola]|uniref:ABC transporter permease n=1 Tax=Sediminivirga luteola TaxID=1774748 RepID=A0A8J2TWY1_9MICO|nr:ABC transporter permease [Sediminivirga luteola]MCI2265482.1 ABC transporter permease [Sediminivirga luteola]GGA10289.1 ABC transporter permease [Sediminivirga luteola]